MFAPVNRNPTPRELSSFGWIMLGGCATLSVVLGVVSVRAALEEGREPAVPVVVWILASVGVAVWLLSRLSPPATRALYVGWMTVTRPIGITVFFVVMTVLFVLFLPVFSLIVRRADPLRLKRRPGDSYWEDVAPQRPSLRQMARLS